MEITPDDVAGIDTDQLKLLAIEFARSTVQAPDEPLSRLWRHLVVAVSEVVAERRTAEPTRRAQPLDLAYAGAVRECAEALLLAGH